MKNVSLVTLLLGLCACVPPTMYHWRGYEDQLYKFYKYPDQMDAFAAELAEIIAEAEPKQTVPPGIYAEYGFALWVRGDAQSAVVQFTKEKQRWPESAYFMDVMIKNAQTKSSRAKGQ